MRKLNKFIIISICFYSAVIIISCSGTGHKVNPIKIGINKWTGYDPFILADKTDLFGKNNVHVELCKFSSATDEIQAIKDEKIDGAYLTLDEVFSLTESGFRGKIVMILDYSMGGDMIIGQQDINSFAELAGKTIGYEKTVVGEFFLNRALQKNHMSKSSVKIINIPKENWINAFREKSVDALVCFNPIATSLLSNEKGNLLFSSSEIPFEIIDVLVFTESFYDNNKPDITNILKSWFDALNYLDANRDKAVEILSAVNNVRPEEYKLELKGSIMPDLKMNKVVFDSKSANNIYKYSQVIVNFMMTKGLLSKRVNTADLFQPEIMLEIEGQEPN